MTFGELRAALESAGERGGPEMPAADASLTELVRFIVDKYHADLRGELPRLGQMAAKVLDAHGAKHPDVLPALAATFRELREELETHMMKEERVLFPYVERLETLDAEGRGLTGLPVRLDPGAHRHDGARARRRRPGSRPPARADRPATLRPPTPATPSAASITASPSWRRPCMSTSIWRTMCSSRGRRGWKRS